MDLVFLILVFFASATAAAVPSANKPPGKSPPLILHPCGREILATLDSWEKNRSWRWAPAGADSHDSYRTPTSQLGVWITVELHRSGDVGAILRSPDRTIALHWIYGSCDPRVAAHASKKETSGEFTDEHLRTLARKHKRGIVYAWSPHMPFSVNGFATIKKAAAKLGLEVFPVLDPGADATAARAAVEKNGLDQSAMMRMESTELFERNMPNHYPSVIVFSGGKVVGPTIPGFKESDTYVGLIAQSLKH
jgi:hypothetical protein